MSDKPPKLPPNVPVLVVDTVIDTATRRFAFTTHAGCSRAKDVAEALQKGEDVPMPEVDLKTGRVPCTKSATGPAMVNSAAYRDNYDGIFGKVPTGNA